LENLPKNACEEYLFAFENLNQCLENFTRMYKEEFMNLNDNDKFIEVYNSAQISSTVHVHATPSFHNNPWFSDIEIFMEQENDAPSLFSWGKILLLFKKGDLNLAFIRWYEYNDIESKFGCPYLKLIDQFDIIFIESINSAVHIIKDFTCDNAYFVNKYIFETE
jgi:hypothetical protein